MYDATVVIAEFSSGADAHLALARLEAEGIAGAVTGDVPNAANFSILGQMQYTAIQLSVARADADRARELLEQSAAEGLEDGWESTAEDAIEGWICLSCDTEVPADQDVCPECATPRSEETREDED